MALMISAERATYIRLTSRGTPTHFPLGVWSSVVRSVSVIILCWLVRYRALVRFIVMPLAVVHRLRFAVQSVQHFLDVRPVAASAFHVTERSFVPVICVAAVDRPGHAVVVVRQLRVLRMVARVFDVERAYHALPAFVAARDEFYCDSEWHSLG